MKITRCLASFIACLAFVAMLPSTLGEQNVENSIMVSADENTEVNLENYAVGINNTNITVAGYRMSILPVDASGNVVGDVNNAKTFYFWNSTTKYISSEWNFISIDATGSIQLSNIVNYSANIFTSASHNGLTWDNTIFDTMLRPDETTKDSSMTYIASSGNGGSDSSLIWGTSDESNQTFDEFVNSKGTTALKNLFNNVHTLYTGSSLTALDSNSRYQVTFEPILAVENVNINPAKPTNSRTNILATPSELKVLIDKAAKKNQLYLFGFVTAENYTDTAFYKSLDYPTSVTSGSKTNPYVIQLNDFVDEYDENYGVPTRPYITLYQANINKNNFKEIFMPEDDWNMIEQLYKYATSNIVVDFSNNTLYNDSAIKSATEELRQASKGTYVAYPVYSTKYKEAYKALWDAITNYYANNNRNLIEITDEGTKVIKTYNTLDGVAQVASPWSLGDWSYLYNVSGMTPNKNYTSTDYTTLSTAGIIYKTKNREAVTISSGKKIAGDYDVLSDKSITISDLLENPYSYYVEIPKTEEETVAVNTVENLQCPVLLVYDDTTQNSYSVTVTETTWNSYRKIFDAIMSGSKNTTNLIRTTSGSTSSLENLFSKLYGNVDGGVTLGDTTFTKQDALDTHKGCMALYFFYNSMSYEVGGESVVDDLTSDINTYTLQWEAGDYDNNSTVADVFDIELPDEVKSKVDATQMWRMRVGPLIQVIQRYSGRSMTLTIGSKLNPELDSTSLLQGVYTSTISIDTDSSARYYYDYTNEGEEKTATFYSSDLVGDSTSIESQMYDFTKVGANLSELARKSSAILAGLDTNTLTDDDAPKTSYIVSKDGDFNSSNLGNLSEESSNPIDLDSEVLQKTYSYTNSSSAESKLLYSVTESSQTNGKSVTVTNNTGDQLVIPYDDTIDFNLVDTLYSKAETIINPGTDTLSTDSGEVALDLSNVNKAYNPVVIHMKKGVIKEEYLKEYASTGQITGKTLGEDYEILDVLSVSDLLYDPYSYGVVYTSVKMETIDTNTATLEIPAYVNNVKLSFVTRNSYMNLYDFSNHQSLLVKGYLKANGGDVNQYLVANDVTDSTANQLDGSGHSKVWLKRVSSVADGLNPQLTLTGATFQLSVRDNLGKGGNGVYNNAVADVNEYNMKLYTLNQLNLGSLNSSSNGSTSTTADPDATSYNCYKDGTSIHIKDSPTTSDDADTGYTFSPYWLQYGATESSPYYSASLTSIIPKPYAEYKNASSTSYYYASTDGVEDPDYELIELVDSSSRLTYTPSVFVDIEYNDCLTLQTNWATDVDSLNLMNTSGMPVAKAGQSILATTDSSKGNSTAMTVTVTGLVPRDNLTETWNEKASTSDSTATTKDAITTNALIRNVGNGGFKNLVDFEEYAYEYYVAPFCSNASTSNVNLSTNTYTTALLQKDTTNPLKTSVSPRIASTLKSVYYTDEDYSDSRDLALLSAIDFTLGQQDSSYSVSKSIYNNSTTDTPNVKVQVSEDVIPVYTNTCRSKAQVQICMNNRASSAYYKTYSEELNTLLGNKSEDALNQIADYFEMVTLTYTISIDYTTSINFTVSLEETDSRNELSDASTKWNLGYEVQTVTGSYLGDLLNDSTLKTSYTEAWQNYFGESIVSSNSFSCYQSYKTSTGLKTNYVYSHFLVPYLSVNLEDYLQSLAYTSEQEANGNGLSGHSFTLIDNNGAKKEITTDTESPVKYLVGSQTWLNVYGNVYDHS